MFVQTYTPIAPIGWSVLLSILPLFILCLLLVMGWLKPALTYGFALLLTAGLAGTVWKMPVSMITSTVFYGILFALFPLFYMIWSSIFLFRVADKCGYINRIKNTLKTAEEGIEWKVLLVGFGLTAFIDSTAGFLAPVAIVTALLVQLGVEPRKSALATLSSSAIPAVFGAVGVPVILLSKVTEQPLEETIRQVAFFDIIPALAAPLITCLATCGFQSTRKFFKRIFIGGCSYAAATLLSVLFISPYLGAIVGAAVYIVVIFLLGIKNGIFTEKLSPKIWLKSWWPFVLLTVFVSIWNIPSIQSVLGMAGKGWPIPFLDRMIMTEAPFGHDVISVSWKNNFLASPGTAIILASLFTALTSGMGLLNWIRMLFSSLRSVGMVAFNLSMISSVGFLMVYSGIAGTLAYPFGHLAAGYMVVAPLMGWLGTFLTGSNAASIALFGGMQAYAAKITGLPAVGIAACFAVAAVGGKMIAPQALEVAVKSSGMDSSSESKLLRKLIVFSLLVPCLSTVVIVMWKLFGTE
ncbi:L-lactate permease/lactate permease [Neobacillus bataviensis]|uniref:L-lactate permease n=1 Tax=Neobacillus bataviensis TaxID=220685 RepID=A0A561CX03_9BACI|nr:L-lactate permease [Neobacillus bataviensis]TWD95751.1 L-lactate permease/lactate permease [Neobacillus bataviensis]